VQAEQQPADLRGHARARVKKGLLHVRKRSLERGGAAKHAAAQTDVTELAQLRFSRVLLLRKTHELQGQKRRAFSRRCGSRRRLPPHRPA